MLKILSKNDFLLKKFSFKHKKNYILSSLSSSLSFSSSSSSSSLSSLSYSSSSSSFSSSTFSSPCFSIKKSSLFGSIRSLSTSPSLDTTYNGPIYSNIHEAAESQALETIDVSKIRNFCIIAHIDHGKSTLSDALLRASGNISEEQAKKGQVLDTLPVERERGITVKANTASIWYHHRITKEPYLLNLIDTPGHVDFTHEVTRSLSSCEGAILLVDAAQNLQAQTLGTLRQARALGITIIPCVTKIDLPNANPEDAAINLALALGVEPETVLLTSAKSMIGIDNLLQAIADRLPSPETSIRDPNGPVYARVIDSWFDPRRGVIALMQVIGGKIMAGQKVALLASDPVGKTGTNSSSSNNDSLIKESNDVDNKNSSAWEWLSGNLDTPSSSSSSTSSQMTKQVGRVSSSSNINNTNIELYTNLDNKTGFSIQDVGVLSPQGIKTSCLRPGQVGYLVAGLRSTRQARAGDTLFLPNEWSKSSISKRFSLKDKDINDKSNEILTDPTLTFSPLPGYSPALPMLFASLFPMKSDGLDEMFAAAQRLALNDPAVTLTKESNTQLGTGLRVGFLGFLHMEVFLQRLKDEYKLDIVTTSPSVRYLIEEVINHPSHKEVIRKEISCVSEWPEIERHKQVTIYEPVVKLSVLSPQLYHGDLMALMKERRATQVTWSYLDVTASGASIKDEENNTDQNNDANLAMGNGEAMIVIDAKVPWQEVATDLHDQIQQRSQGYASLNYEPAGYINNPLEKVDILVNGEPCTPLSFVSPADIAQSQGRKMAAKLKEVLPRQNFEIIIQAAVRGKILARERIAPYRKDVLSRSGKTVGGGDKTRKEKLLAKQREGKKRAKSIGKVEITQEAFWTVLQK